jgi:hypothetical protein
VNFNTWTVAEGRREVRQDAAVECYKHLLTSLIDRNILHDGLIYFAPTIFRLSQRFYETQKSEIDKTNDKRKCAVHETNNKQDVMAHSVNDSCSGAAVIHQNNNQNYHKTETEMSRQQTINDVESKHKTDIVFISCHLHCR